MNEAQLELAIMELFQDEGYEYVCGNTIMRETTDVLLKDDLRLYLKNKYRAEEITDNEVEAIIFKLVSSSHEPLYEANKALFTEMVEGFFFRREDKTKQDLFVRLIDFDDIDNNIFKIVNQFEVKGVQETRIPDSVIFINGLPLVVLEFKSAIKENTTIYNAYQQVTVRYTRDIPDLFKYNAFVVISDGVNNKYGSLFADYDYFYSWNKIGDEETLAEGINSLYSMVKGMFRKDRLLAIVKDFIFFPDTSKNNLKIVCRYPQFFRSYQIA